MWLVIEGDPGAIDNLADWLVEHHFLGAEFNYETYDEDPLREPYASEPVWRFAQHGECPDCKEAAARSLCEDCAGRVHPDLCQHCRVPDECKNDKEAA